MVLIDCGDCIFLEGLACSHQSDPQFWYFLHAVLGYPYLEEDLIELKERREKEERNLEHRICGTRLRDCKHRYFHSCSHNGLQSVFIDSKWKEITDS